MGQTLVEVPSPCVYIVAFAYSVLVSLRTKLEFVGAKRTELSVASPFRYNVLVIDL